ncbi:MAG: hypothetical protein H6577_15545 [Lewinellaceae bacterium]|nr:hypothetical protein [Lewinellaceae bacterium]
MENKDLYELIDGYLDGSLTEAEQREVEQRQSRDPGFRQQVQLQRELRETIGNPGRQRLRSVLADILADEPMPPDEPPPTAAINWWKWAALLAVVVVAGIGIWQWQQPEAAPIPPDPPGKAIEIPPAPPVQETTPAENGPPAEAPTPPTENKPAQPPKTQKQDIPIAAIDPAAFERNASWDAKVKGVVMGNDELKLTLTSPPLDANFPPGKDGQVTIRFSGTLANFGDADTAPLVLLLYDNQNRRPLFQIPLALKKTATDQHLFERKERMALKPGLYYFIVETVEGDALAGGRFTVRG